MDTDMGSPDAIPDAVLDAVPATADDAIQAVSESISSDKGASSSAE